MERLVKKIVYVNDKITEPDPEEAVYRLSCIENALGDDYNLDRLRELVQADREERCWVLPCKPHDHMFEVSCGQVREIIVGGFSIRNKMEFVDYVRMKGGYVECAAIEMRLDKFAQEMYKTRESAENALKGV